MREDSIVSDKNIIFACRSFTVFALTGHIAAEQLAELKGLFELQTNYRNIVLDLQVIRPADRDAVKFLASCEADGIKLQNRPAYIRKWIKRAGN
jgi:hypothetical protein